MTTPAMFWACELRRGGRDRMAQLVQHRDDPGCSSITPGSVAAERARLLEFVTGRPSDGHLTTPAWHGSRLMHDGQSVWV